MKKTPVSASVTPDALRLLRTQSRVSIDRLAGALEENAGTIEAWESGIGSPTLAHLRIIAETCHKPLAAFYMTDELLEEAVKYMPFEFRSLGGLDDNGDPSEAAIEEWNRLLERRDALEDLLGRNEITAYTPPPRVSLKSPAKDAAIIRKWLGLLYPLPIDINNSYDAFHHFRELLEGKNIWVFQTDGVKLEAFRGAASGDQQLPIILVNMSDDIRARNFTLFHELGHILFGDSKEGQVVCKFESYYEETQEDSEVERYCNSFAAAMLLPEDLITTHAIIEENGGALTLANVRRLAHSFGASIYCTLIRLKELKILSGVAFDKLLNELQNTPEKESSGGNYYNTAIARLGWKFITTVVQMMDRKRITTSHAASLLKIKSSNLGKLRTRMGL